jgi:hypothetical protein
MMLTFRFDENMCIGQLSSLSLFVANVTGIEQVFTWNSHLVCWHTDSSCFISYLSKMSQNDQ